MATNEWWADPETKEFLRSALEDMAPKLRQSAIVAQLVPDDTGDPKFWVELGASIMLDKPIIAVVMGDRELPKKLELIADEILRWPEGVTPESVEQLSEAMDKVKRRLEDDE